MKKLFGLSMFMFVFLSCNPHDNKPTTKLKIKEIIPDTITRDVPKWMDEDTFFQRKANEIKQLLGLPMLEKGSSEMQIRIWAPYDIKEDSGQVIVFTNKNLDWSANFYYYKDPPENFQLRTTFGKRTESKNPVSGWKIFIDSFLATGIESLPDYHELLPNYYLPMDSYAITVEIGTPNKYRVYQYAALEFNKEVRTAAMLMKALYLIMKEFDQPIPYI